MISNKFVEECNKVFEALSNVLGIQLDKAKKADLGLIGLYYGELERGVEIGSDKLAQCGLEKLKRLLGELLVAKAFFEKQNLQFSRIVQELISDNPSNSFGARAELIMLNLLLEDYYHDETLSLSNFTKRESPDYYISTPQGDVFLEVTHVRTHSNSKRKGSTGYKIKRAIEAKSKKPYANRETALFLDITNLAYREALAGRDPNLLRAYAEKTLRASQFGAVVLVQSAFNSEGKYIPLYQTFLHGDASEALVGFLNRYYPGQLNYDYTRYYPMPVT
jgi:hypothetical protein